LKPIGAQSETVGRYGGIEPNERTAVFSERVCLNQQMLRADLKSRYHFIVCGSGSSGSVVAARLAENPDVNVLLLEAGGNDDVPSVMDATLWPTNIGTERDWQFQAQSNPSLNGRSIPLGMGKVLGGGSSINGMLWSHGHKNDWDFFASETGDPAWSYESVLNIYRRIEDWHGAPDPKYRGTGGPVFVQPTPDPNPIAFALLEGARSVGIPTFENQNGRMMEGEGGASIRDLLVRDGKRQSVFRSYTFPLMDRPNLTVLPDALVTRLTLECKRTTGVEIYYEGQKYRISADLEVVLSLGAIHTPKVLMQSGIGDQAELQCFGIPVVQHLPGVGHNFQDHPQFGCIWEHPGTPPSSMGGVILFWKSESSKDSPNVQILHTNFSKSSAENAARFGLPMSGWTLLGSVIQPKSRGRIRLTGSDPLDPVQIEANHLHNQDDLKAAIACVKLCQEIGNSYALRPFAKREVMPGNLEGTELENFVRDGVITYWHQACTSKMGRDDMSVVDGNLKVYGIDNLRIADSSVMPHITTGGTMAPCVIIGERAAELLRNQHRV
jgi:choline dehydrogenase